MAYNVMKTDEFPDAVFYRAACECGDKDHDAALVLEYDKEGGYISMAIYQEICVADWQENWFLEAWRRVKFAAKMLFTGRLEAEGSLMIMRQAHIQAFIDALEEGKEKLLPSG